MAERSAKYGAGDCYIDQVTKGETLKLVRPGKVTREEHIEGDGLLVFLAASSQLRSLHGRRLLCKIKYDGVLGIPGMVRDQAGYAQRVEHITSARLTAIELGSGPYSAELAILD